MTTLHKCGDCTLCCKLLHVRELDKPRDTWCNHCDVGHGCIIYQQRPSSCKDFECMWLQEETMPEDLKPNRSHCVLWVNETGEVLMVKVDPNYPEAYMQGEMAHLLHKMVNLPNAKIGIIVGDKKFPLKQDFLDDEDEYDWLNANGMIDYYQRQYENSVRRAEATGIGFIPQGPVEQPTAMTRTDNKEKV